MIWKQKSRELWLKEGDKNAKFFHLSTLIGGSNNSIHAIKDEEGNWIQYTDEIGNYFVQNYINLYTSSSPECPENLLNLISPIIIDQENKKVLKIPDEEEIRQVVKSMNALKAHGPDGLPGLFQNKFWNIIKNYFISSIQTFLKSRFISKEWNTTFITLIPKRQGASNIN